MKPKMENVGHQIPNHSLLVLIKKLVKKTNNPRIYIYYYNKIQLQ